VEFNCSIPRQPRLDSALPVLRWIGWSVDTFRHWHGRGWADDDRRVFLPAEAKRWPGAGILLVVGVIYWAGALAVLDRRALTDREKQKGCGFVNRGLAMFRGRGGDGMKLRTGLAHPALLLALPGAMFSHERAPAHEPADPQWKIKPLQTLRDFEPAGVGLP
jgi:hypothetical protein